MDIIHHSAIGLIGLSVATAVNQEMVGIFFLTGSILPDLDAFLILIGKRFYLKNHQGFSHSLVLLPIYALLVVGSFSFWLPFDWLNFLALSLGFLVHVLLDYSNTYGITLFYPFSKKRISLDAVFFIDTVLISLTVSMLIFAYSLYIYIFLFLFYVAVKVWMQRNLKEKLNANFVVPSAFNPFDFYVYVLDNGTINTYEYNFVSKKKRDEKKEKNLDKELEFLTSKSQLFQDIKKISKAFHITNITRESHTIEIEAKDLALRNFGGKFAVTKLTFNEKEELTDEVSNI